MPSLACSDTSTAEDLPEKTWPKFQRFMQASTHLRPHIQTLRINHSPIISGKTRRQSALLQLKLVLDFHALMNVVIALPKLTSLVLDSVDLFLPPEYSVLDLKVLQPNFQEFHFFAPDTARAFAVDDLFVFLTPFARAHTVVLEYIDFEPPGDNSAVSFVSHFPNLRYLKLREDSGLHNVLGLLRQAAARGRLPALDRLEVGNLAPHDMKSLQRVVDQIGEQLTALTLAIDYKSHSPASCACMHLSTYLRD